MENNPLIYGKNEQKGIVGLEVTNGVATLFIQNEDGKVSKVEKPNRFWVLSSERLTSSARELDGNLHYKYGYQFKTKREFYAFKNQFRDADIYSVSDAKEQRMLLFGETFYKGLKHDQVSVLAFDIETTGLYHSDDSKVLLISNTFRDHKGNIIRKLFSYDEYESPKEMLDNWCDWVREIDPSIICGHNIYSYDLRYLQYIAECSGTELRLGRGGETIQFSTYQSKFRKDASQFYDYFKCSIYGRTVIDTFFLSIKHDIGRKYTSYGLKTIIAEEGLEVKGRQFYDAGQIRNNYLIPEEWRKIKLYAEFDADDALALWTLMGPPLFYWVQSVPKSPDNINCSATGSQINSIMVRSYLQDGHSLPKASPAVPFEGAISLGIPGIYSNGFKIDILSAYPSTLLVFKIFDIKKDPNSHLLKLVEYFFYRRKEYKKQAKLTGDKYFKDMDATAKLALNSFYGFLGAGGLLFNSPACAALITKKCREYIETSILWATGKPTTYWKELNG